MNHLDGCGGLRWILTEKHRIRDYRDLEVWQLALAIVKHIYRAAQNLPPREEFGLASQMRRAAVSVASNIAEGHERGSRAAYCRFVRVAGGSAAELETQLILSRDLGLLPPDSVNTLLELLERERKMLSALARALNRR